MSEFDLIRRFFADLGAARADVALGVGDDCALLNVPAGQQLAVSIDTLSAGVHFFPDCDPVAVGHKALAVGLSDLAAMGAQPAWATLALTLPTAELAWIEGFSAGFAALATAHGVQLVGGDTTRGALSVTVQVHGFIPNGAAVRRSGAQVDDVICVSGTLGDAGLALRGLRAGTAVAAELRQRLEYPMPRVALGLGLRGVATAMIDLSDGLAGDLGHILSASNVGAELALEQLPLSPPVAEFIAQTGDWALPLAAGDDYELCFCVPAARLAAAQAIAAQCACLIHPIGHIRAGEGVEYQFATGEQWRLKNSSFDHFAVD
ncbi:thiamine-phosphate kinase [Chromatium okenii]|uniref:thiamine-phosphate kinase n=1 Tax=Chromatium okenii TaxID=61644 RepID=UPI0026EF54B1|nr:thiamine-phosphate kinase [Chromatium okenii]MBV5308802.1 thiamine-phosphate kinase [Chromatium okenii]